MFCAFILSKFGNSLAYVLFSILILSNWHEIVDVAQMSFVNFGFKAKRSRAKKKKPKLL